MNKKSSVFFLCIINVFISFFLICAAFLTKIVVDKAISKENIWFSCLFLVLVVLVQISLRIIFLLVKNKLSLDIEVNLKKEIYSKIVKKDLNSLLQYHSGEFNNLYLNDVKNIEDGLTNTIPNLCLNISRFVFACIALVYYDYQFLLILVLIGVIVLIFGRYYGKRLKKVHQRALQSDGDVTSYMQESVENIKILKALDANQNAVCHLDGLLEKNYNIKYRRNLFSLIGNVGISSMMNLGYIFAVCYGAYCIYYGKISYGTLIALVQLVSYFESPLASLSGILNRFYAFKASKERILEIDLLVDEDCEALINDFDEIVFENMSFSYDKKIYSNFNLRVKKGQMIALKGASGVGKTTLFNLLLGFIKPQQGNIYVLYQNEKHEISAKTRNIFSYVPQENILFSGTIKDNIFLFQPTATEEEIKNALILADVYEEIMKMPLGLETKLSERGSGISLGQIQRILLAIAILKDKPILLLDEFTSALDFAHEDTIMNHLLTLQKTIIMISHRDVTLDIIKEVRVENHE